MTKAAIIHTRIEPEVKASAEKVLQELGLSPTEAIRIFYRQIILRKGLPFPVHIPDKSPVKLRARKCKGSPLAGF